jgi:hypothetical protein
MMKIVPRLVFDESDVTRVAERSLAIPPLFFREFLLN